MYIKSKFAYVHICNAFLLSLRKRMICLLTCAKPSKGQEENGKYPDRLVCATYEGMKEDICQMIKSISVEGEGQGRRIEKGE